MSGLLELKSAHPSGQMAVDDMANRIASFVWAGVNDGIPVNGS